MTVRRDLRPVLALFMAERRGLMAGGMALAAATILAGVALLGLSGWFITATALAGMSAATALAFDVFAPSAGIRFLALARTGARYGERLVTHDATLRILAALRERLFRGWAAPEAARSLLIRPAKLLFRLTADIDALDSLYLRLLVPAGAAVAAALAAGVALGLMQAWLGLALGGWLLLAGFGLPAWAARRALPWARRRAHAVEALRARTIDLVAGQTELVMAGRLGAQLAATRAADRRLMAAEDRLNRIETGVAAGLGAAAAVALAGTLLGVAALAEAGTIGAPVAALGLLIALGSVEPFAGLRRGAVELGRSLLAARRLSPRLTPAPATARPLPPPEPCAVRFTAVSAGHPGSEPPVFQDLSLTIRGGERIAVIGPSGAGKSTLLALIAGEMAPASGVVEAVDSTLLTQRTELFHDSLRENLALADPAADDARLWEALDAAGLGPDLRASARGLDTPIGEGGLGLSGGQGRRLALARLLLRASPLWLLDEPTEGLDRETACDVLERLTERLGGRSLIVVTHLRREAAGADRLLILKMGCIVASPQRGEPGFDAALAGLRPD